MGKHNQHDNRTLNFYSEGTVTAPGRVAWSRATVLRFDLVAVYAWSVYVGGISIHRFLFRQPSITSVGSQQGHGALSPSPIRSRMHAPYKHTETGYTPYIGVSIWRVVADLIDWWSMLFHARSYAVGSFTSRHRATIETKGEFLERRLTPFTSICV
ncbi:hypothetical protein F5Y16DRAFT_139857 [Xylariaceae sp. FL0255]|nr:hypothetical protein F5Y16DRAFT_139857 [Xylariaceae sp. FL0255]